MAAVLDIFRGRMPSLPPEVRIQYEHNWANRAVKDGLPTATKALWHTFRHASRVHAFPHRTYVVWHLVDGLPVVLDTVRIADVSLSLERGVTVLLKLSKELGCQLVSSTPSKLPGLDVFFWVPAFNEVRWCPNDWNDHGSARILRIALNFKQMRSLANGPVEGAHYLNELEDLRKLYPDFRLIK